MERFPVTDAERLLQAAKGMAMMPPNPHNSVKADAWVCLRCRRSSDEPLEEPHPHSPFMGRESPVCRGQVRRVHFDSSVRPLVEALEEQECVIASMPDAGFNAESPRWAWWYGPLWQARKRAKAALAHFHSPQSPEDE